jgi:uncharacterized membrane protein
MRSHVGRPLALFAVIASSLVVIATAVPSAEARQGPGGSAPCPPRIIDLGTLGGANSEIDGANRRGVWVGAADNAHGIPTPTLWDHGVVRTLGESDGWAADITNAGVLVGNAHADTPNARAFSWYRGTSHLLPIPDWATSSFVRRINQHDDAVGNLTAADGSGVAVEWRHLRTVRVLPVPAGFSGDAEGINDAGDIVGDIGNDTTQIAWEWGHDGSSHALQPEYRVGFSQANLINNRGVAAGGLDFGGQLGLWAATWSRGSVSKLGPFGPEPNFTFAFGQDQLGDYVGSGTYSPDDFSLHVFVMRAGSGTMLTMLPLSGNVDDRSNAHAVVPAYMGQPGIAVGGESTTSNGDDHATVWTCAFRQAFAPPTVAGSARVSRRAPAWKRMVDAARPLRS